MVYKYKRKANQAKWSEDAMMLAIADCNAGVPVKATAKIYNLPYATLYRHWKKGTSTAQLGRFRKVFNDQQEGDLQAYLQEMDNVFYGLTREDFKALVFIYAKKNNLTYPQSWDKNEKAGDDWLAGFMRRNPQITLRVPEATSIARVKRFNRPQVERFYELLIIQTEKHGIDGTRIYNVDETGIQTSTNKPPKVLSVKGKKQVGVISSVERGQNTTIVCCCNAAGSFLPPFMIFARKRMQDRLLDGSPPEARGTCSSSGWINGEIFLEWLKFFVGHVRPTAEKKVLLLLDNHESHKHYPVLEYASQNHVVILSLPPHTSNKLQPLDVAVYGSLKIYFEQEINRFQKAHPGRIVNQYDVARLFTPAYLKCSTPNNAIKGFQSSGIWPTNMDIWEEKDFAPSSTTMADRNTANSEATLQESTNQEVETMNDGIRPSISGTQSSSRRSETSKNNSDDSSTDDDIESLEPMTVIVQVHNSTKENKELLVESCPGFVESRGVSPSIISDLHEEDPLKDISSITPDIQPSSGQKESTSTERVDSGTENTVVDQRITYSTPPPIISRPDEKDQINSINKDVCDLSMIDSTPPSNKPNKGDSDANETTLLPSAISAVSYYSPKEIKPLPSPHIPTGTRKRKIQKSEVLTSTPVKEEQKVKFAKANTKVLKNLRDLKTKTTLKKSTGKTKNAKTTKDIETTKNTRKKSKQIENNEKYTCNFCAEDYIEVNGQPLDDWIQCNFCKQWSHEKCTAFEGTDIFICDHCTDN